MAGNRRYSDEQLRDAVAAATSWRDTLRRLGLAATSSSAIRSVRYHAERLAIDSSHFTGGRRWTDAELTDALSEVSTWTEAAARLRLRGGSAVPFLQRHAARLGIDTNHLDGVTDGTPDPSVTSLRVDLANLSRAGSQIAAAWFTLCGQDVSWPLEPCRYDLLVSGNGETRRVQVKTTTTRDECGSWRAHVSTNGRHETRVYTTDEIDDFFIIDGDLNFYLIPIRAMRGMHYVRLRAYETFKVRDGAPATCPGGETAGAPTRT